MPKKSAFMRLLYFEHAGVMVTECHASILELQCASRKIHGLNINPV